MKMRKTILLSLWLGSFLVIAQLTSTIVEAQQASDPRVADLVRAGKVRVALYLPQYTKDPATGELRGWPIELVRVLGDAWVLQACRSNTRPLLWPLRASNQAIAISRFWELSRQEPLRWTSPSHLRNWNTLIWCPMDQRSA